MEEDMLAIGTTLMVAWVNKALFSGLMAALTPLSSNLADFI
jgi:hypothetical protein